MYFARDMDEVAEDVTVGADDHAGTGWVDPLDLDALICTRTGRWLSFSAVLNSDS